MTWRVLNSAYVFDNPFVRVRQDHCKLPSGLETDFFTVEIRNWAMVVAFTPENDMVLVRQYRHSTGQELIELPAGVIKSGESPKDAIQREFSEETGFELINVEEVGSWFTMSGKSNCQVTVFVGQTGKKKSQKLDREETVQVLFRPAKKVLEMIRDNEIKTAPYIAGILAVKEKHAHYFE